MPDFASVILNSHADFSAADISTLDPPKLTPKDALMISEQVQPHQSTMVQGVQKCVGDYDKLPLGWRNSAFMGKCGFKIQHKNFYSADTPCFPIQDISCMGPLQKKAWANVCGTEFPCQPPKGTQSIETPTVKVQNYPTWSDTFIQLGKMIDENIAYVVGIAAGSCLAVGMIVNRTERKKDSR
jgi:hypothetical protein